MWRTFVVVFGAIVCSAGFLSAGADDQKTDIKGGIEGKIKKVDVESKKLTITTTQGRERTFTITDDTMMVGPRGGKVRRHLKDPRFHEGFSVTIVAEGNTATEVHLGFAHESGQEKAEPAKTAKKDAGAEKPAENAERPIVSKKGTPEPSRSLTPAERIARHKEAKKLEEEEDEEEIPGHIKSFDASRRILVVSLLNGKNRTFILAKDVPVHVKNTTSKLGLTDPALKVGAVVTVVTEEGGHKVKELKIVPAAAVKRKAG